MKREEYTKIICSGFCTFYKEGNEGLMCGTYHFLTRNLTPGELESAVKGTKLKPDFSHDREIKTLICGKCEFLIDGCDFRAGLDAPPCGGYAIIEWLLKKG